MELIEIGSDNLEYVYKLIVTASEINTKIDERLCEVAPNVKLPGFRPGKVPAKLIRKRYGRDLREESIEVFVQQAIQRILTDNSIKPALKPEVTSLNVEVYEDETQDLSCTLEVIALPKISLIKPEEISFNRYVSDVEEKEVDNFLSELAKQYKDNVVEEKKRKIVKGDIAVIDFEGFLEDVAFEGGKGNDFPLEIGGGQFIPGFEEQIIGHKVGESFDVTVMFPENYQAADLAGKEAVFKVKVHEIRVAKPRDIDDQLAQLVGLEDLEELKKLVRNRIESENERESRELDKRQLLEYLEENVDFAIPSKLIDKDFESLWNNILKAREEGTLDENDKNKSDEELHEQYKLLSKRRVKLGLYINEAGNHLDVKVEDYEVEQAIKAQTSRFTPEQAQQYEQYIKSNEQALAQIRMPLFEEKVVDAILAFIPVKHEVLPRDEFVKKRDSITEELEAKFESKTGEREKVAKKASAKKASTKKASAKKTSTKKASSKKASAKKASAKKKDT